MKQDRTKYWFKAKNYGWGWYPITWQGWIVLVGFISLVWYESDSYARLVNPSWSDQAMHYLIIAAFVTILLVICFKTGEKPQWRWAGKPLNSFFARS